MEDVFIWVLMSSREGLSSRLKAVLTQIFYYITKSQMNRGLQSLHFEKKARQFEPRMEEYPYISADYLSTFRFLFPLCKNLSRIRPWEKKKKQTIPTTKLRDQCVRTLISQGKLSDVSEFMLVHVTSG